MNKRPLLCVLAGFVLGEVWMWQFHGTAAIAALCGFTIICLIIEKVKKGSFFILFTIGLVVGGVKTQIWIQSKEQIYQQMNGSEVKIQGQIEQINELEYSYSLVISHLNIEGKNYGGKLLAYLDEKPNCYLGSTVLLKGKIEAFELPSNPGGFNQRSYQEGKGIFGSIVDANVLEFRLGSFLIKDGIYEIRQKCINYMKEKMDKSYAGLGMAMAYGEKGSLEEEEKSLYEFAGISHVLAVSGLHMSLLGAAFYKVLRKMGVTYFVSVCSAFPCIIIYAVMTGMSSSCLRAAIMLCIYLSAEWKGYYYDLPSSLALAAIFLLYEIPARLYDSGFLLSFGAMVSVGIICPFLFHIFQYETGKKKVRDAFFSGFIITVFTLPFSLRFFFGFSLIGLLLNLIVIPVMTFLVPMLFLGGLGWSVFIPGWFSDVCFQAAQFLLKFYQFLCETAKKIPMSYIQAGYRGIGFAICYYGLLIIIICVLFILFRRYGKFGYLIVPIIIGFMIFFLFLTGRNDTYLTMLDVGQGDGILYHTKDGEVCMIDGGSTSEKNVGRYVIRPALEYYGIHQIDYWFLSHLDEDHISGAKELLEAGYPISNLILPYRKEKKEKQMELENLAQKNKTKIYYMKQGDQLKLNNSTFYCLHPDKKYEGDENENSIVLLLDMEYQQVLLTGDAEKDGELNMTKELKKYKLNQKKERILKVGHHGSSNGTKEELLKVFQPDSALISCAIDNSYGHPAPDTLERIKKYCVKIYFTMYHGAIEIRIGKETSYLGYGVVN